MVTNEIEHRLNQYVMYAATRKFIRNSFLLSNKLRLAISLVVCLYCACFQPAVAQVCNDTSGEVVFSQTFGTASSTGSIAGLTTYIYEPINCPGDGQYSIVSSLDGTCFNATWYAVAQDHTPNDVQGNMLIVNGGSKAGVFYQQPVLGLCKETSYELSVWVLNVLRTQTCIDALVPNLSINVETKDGVVIQSTVIGPIGQTDSPTWRRCSVLFTTPATGDAVVIKLINNQGDYGCGNDMIIDDFQVKQCGECADIPNLVYVPDVFTPNNDGVNDTLAFFFRASAAASFTVKIFNRWGSLIFASQNPGTPWDGTYAGVPCASDTYTWEITHRSTTGNKGDSVRTGHVLLIR